jgi:PIN domain nuclease of toxin-antitoxin system
MKPDTPLILDTHVWFWLAVGDKTLLKRQEVKQLIPTLATRPLYLASISLWEIAMLESKGRIALKSSCTSWLEKAIQKTRVHVLELTPAMAADSAALPGEFHGDPADRMITASARSSEAVLLTRDRNILTYSKEGHLSTIRV